jgi:stage IV sporulation protein FA
MDNDIKMIKSKIKKKNKKTNKNRSSLYGFISKLLITIILTLITLILLKSNNKLKTFFYNKVYDNNISFATINKWYENHFGSSIPFKELVEKDTKAVFNNKLEYSKKEKYLDGVKLSVDKNYLVPILESGMVVYIGKKEGYGNTVIVQQVNGVDVWYGNINNPNVKLYDYVEKGKLLGDVKNNNLYLVFKKDGKVLSYEKNI